MPDVIRHLANENSTDRDPNDDISPSVDASINTFEHDPDDSVDITADYDDQIAQDLEDELDASDNHHQS